MNHPEITINRKRRFEFGQDLVEYALMVPIFLLIIAVIFDLGRATYYYAAIQNSAREGARYGIVHPDDSIGIENAVRSLSVGLDPAAITVISARNTANKTIEVAVSYRFTPLTPVIAMFLGVPHGDGIELNSRASMRVER